MKRFSTLTAIAVLLISLVSFQEMKAVATWDHVTHDSDISASGSCDGSFVVDANYSATGEFTVTYTFGGTDTVLGPYTDAGDIYITGLCAGTYSDITITSTGDGTTDVWGSSIVIADPFAPQPYFTCDSRKYQSIKLSGDYWLYEVLTDPVTLVPLVNLTNAGATGNINGMVFRKDDGYIYITTTGTPHTLYRIGSDFTIVNLGPISGFTSGAYINAATLDENGDIIFKDYRHDDISGDFYRLDLSAMTVSLVCDYPHYTGHRNNLGDIARNPINGKYYGLFDSTSTLVEMDFNTCSHTEITTDRWFPGANGAFWIAADGVGYGYENATGNLTSINLSTGEVDIIGTGSTTSQTDGCSCEALEMNHTISTDTTVEGDTVIFTITIYNNWQSHLSTVTYNQNLCAGFQFSAEPTNLTGGIILGATSIRGNSSANFTIDHLPLGTCSFDICVDISRPYSGARTCESQPWLSNLPADIGADRYSDNPRTPAISDATSLVILSDDECIGNWNTSVTNADFGFDHKSVDVNSTKPMENVVLEFYDGSHQVVNSVSTYNDRINPTGANENKCITGVWIKTACNGSGDGPEYGKYIPSPIWDGLCGGNEPTTGVVFEHVGDVISSGGPSVIHFDDIVFDPPSGHVTITDHPGHNSTGTGVTGPEIPDSPVPSGPTGPPFIPGHRFNSLADGQISVFPNPARSLSYLNINGLDYNEDWQVHVVTIDGKFTATKQVTGSQINLADMNLVTGVYFLVFESGQERKSIKLIITE